MLLLPSIIRINPAMAKPSYHPPTIANWQQELKPKFHKPTSGFVRGANVPGAPWQGFCCLGVIQTS